MRETSRNASFESIRNFKHSTIQLTHAKRNYGSASRASVSDNRKHRETKIQAAFRGRIGRVPVDPAEIIADAARDVEASHLELIVIK